MISISKHFYLSILCVYDCVIIFFHPDYTVGLGISPNHALRLVGCNHRWGNAPRPEDVVLLLLFNILLSFSFVNLIFRLLFSTI